MGADSPPVIPPPSPDGIAGNPPGSSVAEKGPADTGPADTGTAHTGTADENTEKGTPDTGTADESTDTAWSARWRASVVFGVSVWLAALLMYVLVTAVSWLPFGDPPALGDVVERWHRWDTTWYVIIAESGYHYDSRATAFFPLYPMLVRGVHQVIPGTTLEAALVVSVLACLAALILVHRLTAEILGGELARRTVFYLIAFPTGFYLVAAYNESLFIALAVGSLYCMRRRHWWMAGLLAGFASATRLAGVLLAAAFVYEYLRQCGFRPRRIRLDLLAVVLVPAGLIAYAFYCWRSFGDPLYFQKAQTNWFRTDYKAPWTTIAEVIRLIANTQPLLGPTSVRNIINLTTALAVLALLLLALDSRWGIGPDQAYLVIFAGADIVLPLLSPIHSDYPLSSMWRFALECIPVFMVLAKMGRNAHFDRAFTMVALAVQGVMILTFVQNQFVG
jgi:hypothetical protein